MEFSALKKYIINGGLDGTIGRLYGARAALQRERYLAALDAFAGIYGAFGDIRLFSSPGRTEICGNHTDHNHGRVVAGAVNLDMIAFVRINDTGIINLHSTSHAPNIVDTRDLCMREEEKNNSNALIRGICARFKELSYAIGGFDAYATSDVLAGSGLSSSAAFELLIATILTGLYKNGPGPIEAAKIAQYAENRYFGKPCGLMDQTACAVGGIVSIDFKEPDLPAVKGIDFDFSSTGHSLCIVDTGGSHSNLTEEYAAITGEMAGVAENLGAKYLREADETEFYKRIRELRGRVSDRAILRACHFFEENRRVAALERALETGDFDVFLSIIKESGRSSFMYLQNVYASSNPKEQGLSLGLCAAERLLKGSGACRVHGGGFGGTIQAFMPDRIKNEFVSSMEEMFGKGCAMLLSIRADGACEIALG